MRRFALASLFVGLLAPALASGQQDVNDPVLIDFTVSPVAYDTGLGDVTLTFCANAADDLSGVEFIQFGLWDPATGSNSSANNVRRFFPSGTLQASGCITMTRNQFSPYQTWGVGLALRDYAGNYIDYVPKFVSPSFPASWPDSCDFGPCIIENRSSGSLPDADNDTIPDDADNCPDDMNTDQSDVDLDLIGDVCDPFPFDRDNEKAQCFEDLTQAQDDLAACEARPAFTDTDGDGEEDSTDACPDTPMGAAVDQGGCSQAQFCALVDASTSRGRRECRYSDWGNDEPLARPGPGDCEEQGGLCVPAAP